MDQQPVRPRCTTKGCGEEAVVRAYWPGQTVIACFVHGAMAHQTASAMGFELKLEPVDEVARAQLVERLAAYRAITRLGGRP